MTSHQETRYLLRSTVPDLFTIMKPNAEAIVRAVACQLVGGGLTSTSCIRTTRATPLGGAVCSPDAPAGWMCCTSAKLRSHVPPVPEHADVGPTRAPPDGDDVVNPEAKQARLERAFKQRAIPEAASLLPVLDELAARPGLMWRYDTELGIRASCTTATPTITTGRAGSVGDAWTDDGEPDHLCPVALIAMRTEAETAEHLQELRTIHDNAAERVHDALRRSGHYHPAAGLDPVRLNGAEKLLVMASDGEAGAGSYAWPPALSDEEVTNTRRAIGQYLIAATAAEPAERQ